MSFREYDNRMQLMKGHAVPKAASSSNIVRVFVSSTFADMSNERNQLYNNAYPELRKFCQGYGLEFQVIDMRWGVRDTATVDHSTTALCLLEVDTCKRVSFGPYFAVFIGNRYGYQPLPSSIPETDFATIKRNANENSLDEDGLLEKWYKIDNNLISPARILEPITKYLPHFGDENPKFATEKEANRKEWQITFKRLSDILRVSVKTAVKRGEMKKNSSVDFSKSVTQMEIEEAMKGKDGTLFYAYSREISDLGNHLKNDAIGKFIDIAEDDLKVDAMKQKLLKSLRNRVKNHTKGTKTFKQYSIRLQDVPDILSGKTESQLGKLESQESYLDRLSSDFVSDIKHAVTKHLVMSEKKRKTKQESTKDFLFDEVLHHTTFAHSKTADFCGRTQLLESISDAVNDDQNHQPLLLVGSSGSGKTSVIAKLVEIHRMSSADSIILYRFLGTSPESSSIHKLLKNLVLQLSFVFGAPVPASHLLQNFTDTVELFSKLIKSAPNYLNKDKRLLIFLDSIDQLSIDDGAHRMTWLPKILPDKVKIVVSSLPEPDFNIVPVLRRYISEENVFSVRALDDETAKEILQKWLSNIGRCLTEQQLTKILEAFRNSPYPLFLKLMFEEAKRWRSHNNVDDIILPESSRTAILRFYEKLEKEHGRTFVAATMGFIVAARDGVTENELQDLLSLDNEVLYDTYEHWSPPSDAVVRIPTFTWTRLFYDLREYIVERQATGHTMLALYHRQFIEVAKERYLHPSAAKKIYTIMCEYFSGYYASDKRKTLKLKMWNEDRDVDRKVAQQPLQFSHDVYNLRKLRELPFCLLRSGAWHELTKHVLGNATWIQTKIMAFSIKELIEDYDLALKDKKDIEVQVIRDAIKLAKPTLEFQEAHIVEGEEPTLNRRSKRGGVRNHLMFELFCRLEFFIDEFPDLVGKLVFQCRKHLESSENEVFLPDNGCFQPPGGPLRTTITGFKTPVTFTKFSNNGEMLAMGSKDGSLMIWDAINDEVMQQLEGHTDAVLCIAFDDLVVSIRLASISLDNTIKIFSIDNGSILAVFSSMPGMKDSVYNHLTFIKNELICVTDSKVEVREISDTLQKKRDLSNKVTAAAVSQAAIAIGSEDGNCIFLHPHSCADLAQLHHPDEKQFPVICITVLNGSSGKFIILWKDGCFRIVDYNNLDDNFVTVTEQENVLGGVKSPEDDLFALFSPGRVEIYSIGDTAASEIKLAAALNDHESRITKAKFAKKDVIATAYENNKVVLWKLTKGGEAASIGTWVGMGAPIDHLEINGGIGVTGSLSVFYLKLWNVIHEDITKFCHTTALDLEKCAISPSGRSLLYQKRDEVVVAKVSKRNNEQTTSSADFGIVSCFESDLADSILLMKYAEAGQSIIIFTKKCTLRKYTNVAEQNKQTSSTAIQLPTAQFQEDDSTMVYANISNRGEIGVLVLRNSKHEKAYQLLVMKCADLRVLGREMLSENDIQGEVTALAITDNGGCILLGTSRGVIYVFNGDAETERLQMIASNSIHKSAVTCLTLSNSQKMFYSGSMGRVRRLWNLGNSGTDLIHELPFDSLLEAGVTCAHFTADDKYIITGSKERCVQVWNTTTGELVGAIYVYAPVKDLVVLDNNEVIYTSELGYVSLLEFRPPDFDRGRRRLKTRTSSVCVLM